MDVTTLADRRSPGENKHSTKIFNVRVTAHADSTKKPNLIVVGACKRDNLGHNHLPYSASNVYEPNLNNSVDGDFYAEVVDYVGPF